MRYVLNKYIYLQYLFFLWSVSGLPTPSIRVPFLLKTCKLLARNLAKHK